MSQEKVETQANEGPNFFDRWLPSGPVRIYAAVMSASALFVSFWLANNGWSMAAWVLPPMVALAAMTGKFRFTGPVFLVLMLGALATTRAYEFRPPMGTAIELQTWFLSIATMVFLIAQHRFMAFKNSIFPSPERLTPPWAGKAKNEELAKDEPIRRDAATFKPAEFWDVVIGTMGSLMIAQLVLHFLPEHTELELFADLHANAVGAVFLAWTMGVLTVAALGFFAWRRWMHLSRREAGIYLRSVTWRWNAKEHEAIERYRARRERRARQ